MLDKKNDTDESRAEKQQEKLTDFFSKLNKKKKLRTWMKSDVNIELDQCKKEVGKCFSILFPEK